LFNSTMLATHAEISEDDGIKTLTANAVVLGRGGFVRRVVQ
jgi:hypothetical protein